MPLTTHLITAEQLLRMPDDDLRHELVEGRLITMPPPAPVHGIHTLRIARPLAAHVEARNLGVVLVEAGFKLKSRPDTVRAPDVSFVASSRIPRELSAGYWKGAPDLAVEVVSPGERAREMARKIREYFAAGARAVWVVHPRRRTVTRYAAPGSPEILTSRDTLAEPDVLPGFRLRLSALFSEPPASPLRFK